MGYLKFAMISGILLLVGLLSVLLRPHPAVARVSIQAEAGRAVWFHSVCHDNEDDVDVATWTVRHEIFQLSQQKNLQIQLHNGYPGYQLSCRVSLANTGDVPLKFSDVNVTHKILADVTVDAQPAAGVLGHTLMPCGFTPAWNSGPDAIPTGCYTALDLVIQVEAEAEENSDLGYDIAVKLSEA